MTQIGAVITVDAKDAIAFLQRWPREVASAANAVSYDLHNNKTGFIRRRLISRAGKNFKSSTKGRRFVAAALDRAGGSHHRLSGRITLDRIKGETFTIDEVLQAFAGGANPSDEPMFVPLPFAQKGRGKLYFRELREAARLGDIKDAGLRFARVGDKLYVVRQRKRRSRDGREYDFIAQVRREVRRPHLIKLDEIFADLPDKMRANFIRELNRRTKAALAKQSSGGGAP